jgi:hypothetical protein
MKVSQSEFARIAGVTKQGVSKLIKNNQLRKDDDGLIDTDVPVNAAYLLKHRKTVPVVMPEKEREKEKPVLKNTLERKKGRVGRPKKERIEAPKKIIEKPEVEKKKKEQRSEKLIPDSNEERSEIRAESRSEGIGKYQDRKSKLIMDKPYYEAKKVRADVKRRELEIAQIEGSVIDERIIASLIGELGQGIRLNFIDVCLRQSEQICAMLGAPGREREVQEYLEVDNGRRLEEAKRGVTKIMHAMKQKPSIVQKEKEDQEI